MPLKRRDLLLGLGGGAAGLAVTPAPWKLLDDVSIWTQRRHSLPLPPRGEVSFRPTLCALCPAGCALRVRMVGARPVSVLGEARHPLGGGGCPLGLTLHQLAYHPLRLRGPARRLAGRLEPVTLDAAVAALAGAVKRAREDGRSVLVLDRRPGRVSANAWREVLPDAVYATGSDEGATFVTLARAFGCRTPLGADLERVRVLLSFGAPVLEGWGNPASLREVRGRLRVVQLDSWRSPSAELADEWIEIAPASEGALALALAALVVRRDGVRVPEPVRTFLEGLDVPRLCARAGVAPARLTSLAASLTAAPTLAVGGGDPAGGPLGEEAERAIGLLDLVLGSGRESCLRARRALPGEPPAAVTPLADVPAGSVGLAILDSGDDGRALPWPLLARTLAREALVVSLSPFDFELARRAELLVPAPAPLEGWEERLPETGAMLSSYALAAPVLAKPEGATGTHTLLARLAEALGVTSRASHEDRLKARVAAMHAEGRGRWMAREASGYTEAAPADAEAAHEVLAAGGCWIDAPPELEPLSPDEWLCPRADTVRAWTESSGGVEPALVAFGARGSCGATPVSPLLSKLHQESELRPGTRRAAMHPDTARNLGFGDGSRVRLDGPEATVVVELRHDATLARGRVALAAGPPEEALHPGALGLRVPSPGATPLCEIAEDGTWRGTRVRVTEA